MINKDLKSLYKRSINFNMYFDSNEAVLAEAAIRQRGRVPVTILNDNNLIVFELKKEI